MEKKIVADINPLEARIALLEDDKLVEIHVERRGKERLVGNIYKGRVANVLPGMQAAFVDIGLERNAFLYAGDILADTSDFEFGQKSEQPNLRPKGIEEMVKQGQEIMVQILKQPGGAKGARITTHVTLPGRMLVLMPTVNHVGVSRRIEDEQERSRLKEIMEEIKPKDMGIIVRTAAVSKSKEEFIGEIRFLERLWQRIVSRSDILRAPRLIHAEESLIFRTVRDMFTPDVCEFAINDREYYDKVTAVAGIIAPHLKDRVCLYTGGVNIFDDYGIQARIDKALEKKVWMKNGAYIIIDETEALTVIDVNTGKFVGDTDLQETILAVNIEAAKEIARQLRLRDISGIIVIDFIDMEVEGNKQKVIDSLETALAKDRTKTNVLGITSLGLIEMTRKKVRRKLSNIVKRTCPYCGGSGTVDNEETTAMNLRRLLLRQAANSDVREYLIEVNPLVAKYIEGKDAETAIIPKIEGIKFYIVSDEAVHLSDYKVIEITSTKEREKLIGKARVFC
ncbi:MAG: Rne/Rng family ribonuclease [Christensenellales bacterium]|jgi:ribonuclease G